MNTPSIEQLNKEFSLDKTGTRIQFSTGAGNIPVVEILNEQAKAVISLQGAHVLSWIPAGEEEVIWLSEDATFAPGKSVRGGVPICWPWFGPHESNAAFPAHGFARTVMWQVTQTDVLEDGAIQIRFKLDMDSMDPSIQAMWHSEISAEYSIVVGKTLAIELTTVNNSNQAIAIGEALHTYFNVADLTETSVHGLEGIDYLDKTDSFSRKTQTGPVTIKSEVDRIYLQTPGDVIIENSKRRIVIKKQGSQSTVVWNPWQAAAEKMGDLGKDGYLQMLCVESANAAEDIVSVDAGGRHTLSVVYMIEPA